MPSVTPIRSLPDFRELFGRPPDLAALAPGRVNLMGDHTDYNGGYVLPMPIPQHTRVELARRTDRRIRVWSANIPDAAAPEEYEIGQEAPGRQWLDYVQGVTQALARDGHAVLGCDLRIESEVPLGSGLSSSAALEVALLRALRAAWNLSLSDLRLAQLGQLAEQDFVGAPVGIMDQMVTSLGHPATALFLDTRTLSRESVSLATGSGLVVIHSGVTHHHAAGQYVKRRQECEQAARLLGVPQLRDLQPSGGTITERTVRGLRRLPEVLQRRVRHVTTENTRVLQTVAALRAQDAPAAGRLFYESHESLRDDYECSIAEIDLLVELSRVEPGVYGARLTGGGFGGSVVILSEASGAEALARSLVRRYDRQSGRTGQVLIPTLNPRLEPSPETE